jgi:hypothetical protein
MSYEYSQEVQKERRGKWLVRVAYLSGWREEVGVGIRQGEEHSGRRVTYLPEWRVECS